MSVCYFVWLVINTVLRRHRATFLRLLIASKQKETGQSQIWSEVNAMWNRECRFKAAAGWKLEQQEKGDLKWNELHQVMNFPFFADTLSLTLVNFPFAQIPLVIALVAMTMLNLPQPILTVCISRLIITQSEFFSVIGAALDRDLRKNCSKDFN